MRAHLVRLRQRAAADIDDAVDHYRQEAGEAVALRFVEALERCTRQIASSPHLGSLRFSYELDIPELRVLAVRRFAYLVFYLPSDGRIDVWRVLHGRRDIPTAFGDGS